MLLQRKNKVDITNEVIKEVVREYFKIIKELYPNFCGLNISEILRYSICVLLGLETKGYLPDIEKASISVCNLLQPLIKKYSLDTKSLSYRMGFLEACVHCLEMSRKKAGV